MDANARAKLQKTCRDTDLVTVLDHTTSAAFHHQLSLALSEGVYFDPAKRGLALAGAGRSAATSHGASATAYSETIGRDNFQRILREHWTGMSTSFAGDNGLSS